jgi:hypothetical protein
MPAMNGHPAPLPLPPLSAAVLLRALFKRPVRTGGTAPGPVRHLLGGIDEASVARYRAALGFGGAHLPLTYWYLLAQRAHLAAMLGAAFPYRLAGAIHVDNALSAGSQPALGRPLLLETAVEAGAPAANGAVRAALDTHASQDGHPVFTCRSTYLVVRGRHGGGPRPAAPERAPMTPLAGWQLSSSSGRDYAALSGDWNPIHLWAWSARLMGLKAPIIHGMHTLGRACAELERRRASAGSPGRPLPRNYSARRHGGAGGRSWRRPLRRRHRRPRGRRGRIPLRLRAGQV